MSAEQDTPKEQEALVRLNDFANSLAAQTGLAAGLKLQLEESLKASNAVARTVQRGRIKEQLRQIHSSGRGYHQALDALVQVLERDQSPQRTPKPRTDALFDLAFRSALLPNPQTCPAQYATFQSFVDDATLLYHLKNYFVTKSLAVPEFAVAYFRGTIVLGRMEIPAQPSDLTKCAVALLPVYPDGVAYALIKSIYRANYDPLPQTFSLCSPEQTFEERKFAQTVDLTAYLSRGAVQTLA